MLVYFRLNIIVALETLSALTMQKYVRIGYKLYDYLRGNVKYSNYYWQCFFYHMYR